MAMFFDPFRDVDRVAGQLLDARQGPRLMPMDLYRDADHYVLNADLPGIDPGSVDIDIDGQVLTIRAERTPRSQEGVKWIARERGAGTFLRQLNLGQGIDTDRHLGVVRERRAERHHPGQREGEAAQDRGAGGPGRRGRGRRVACNGPDAPACGRSTFGGRSVADPRLVAW